nr:O-antigen ligase family protein [Pseudomarimonas arenosa]
MPVWLLWAAVAVLPFGRIAELPMALAALLGLMICLRTPGRLRSRPAAMTLLLFLGYWLPELLSAVDSLSAQRSWLEVAVDLRYLPMLLYFTLELSQGQRAERCAQGLGWIVLLWGGDALLQASTGLSLGGQSSQDRLSGIFGAEDLKLGPMLVALCPFLLVSAWRRHPGWALAALTLVGTAVLLAGTRSAWIMLAVVVGSLCYVELGARRSAQALLGMLAAGLLLGTLAYQTSTSFASRIDRSLAVLSADREGLDHALAFRLPIWENAARMAVAHPINGVGVRAYRDVYADFASPGDPWVDFAAGKGAAHAHNIVLELLSETGLLGLLLWLVAIGLLLRQSRQCALARSSYRSAWATALIAMLFPLNTHYAVYASEWGGLLLVLAAGWLASWAGQSRRQLPNPS